MKKNIIVAISILLFFLTGCSNGRINPEKVSSIKRIGVISHIGNTMTSYKLGLTAFNNHTLKTNVSNWNIDTFITREFSSAIKTKTNVKYIPISNRGNNFSRGYQEGVLHIENIKSEIKRTLNGNNLDALIFVTKGQDDPLSKVWVEGFNLINKFGFVHTNVYLRFIIVGIDNNKLVEIGSSRLLESKRVSSLVWPNGDQPIPVNGLNIAEEKIKGIIKKGVGTALINYGLVR